MKLDNIKQTINEGLPRTSCSAALKSWLFAMLSTTFLMGLLVNAVAWRIDAGRTDHIVYPAGILVAVLALWAVLLIIRPNDQARPPSALFGGWVDAKKTLPKKDGHYIIYVPSADPDKPFVAMAWYNTKSEWSLLPECWCKAITHWMPKPKPPNLFSKQ